MLQKQYLRKLGKHPKYLPPTVSPPGRSVSRVIYIYIYTVASIASSPQDINVRLTQTQKSLIIWGYKDTRYLTSKSGSH